MAGSGTGFTSKMAASPLTTVWPEKFKNIVSVVKDMLVAERRLVGLRMTFVMAGAPVN